MSQNLPSNIDRFSGFADTYNTHRPTPPMVIVDILTQIAECPRPKLVVDIGCGTGLATRIWADRAERIIGIEPNPDMLDEAEEHTSAANITYQDGLSTNTGLPDGCADIVTISQALHWMEPGPTFAEIARILRPGGVFAAIDCDWPPTMNWQAEQAYIDFTNRIRELEKEQGGVDDGQNWSKSEHLSRMRASKQFRFTKEVMVHNVERGNDERLCGLAITFGGVENLLKLGMSELEIGLNHLRATADHTIGPNPIPWYFSYRMRIGVK